MRCVDYPYGIILKPRVSQRWLRIIASNNNRIVPASRHAQSAQGYCWIGFVIRSLIKPYFRRLGICPIKLFYVALFTPHPRSCPPDLASLQKDKVVKTIDLNPL